VIGEGIGQQIFSRRGKKDLGAIKIKLNLYEPIEELLLEAYFFLHRSALFRAEDLPRPLSYGKGARLKQFYSTEHP